MFGKAARQKRKIKQVMGQMDNMMSGLVVSWAEHTGDKLEIRLTELRNDYGDTGPADIVGPAQLAMWTYNKSTVAIDDGKYAAAELGLKAVDAWLDGGEMIVPGSDSEQPVIAG